MNVPNEFITLGLGAVGALASRSIYNLIERNKVDSDSEDNTNSGRMEKLVDKLQKTDDKYRDIDREQYKMIGDIREQLAYMKGFKDGKGEK